MAVDVDLRQRADVDAEFALRRKGVRKAVIQSVNTLDDEDVLRSELHEIALVLGLAGLEVELRHLNSLTVQKLRHLLVEQLDVESLEAFEIIVSVLVARAELAVAVIVVQSDRMRFKTVGTQLDRQSMGK